MNKIINIAFGLAFLSGILYSCTEDSNNGLDQSGKLNIEFKQTSMSSIDKLNNWIAKNSKDKSILNFILKDGDSSIEFDFNNPISYNSNNTETVIVNQKTFNPGNNINYGISFIDNADEFNQFMIIKTINESDTIKKLEYYSFNNNLLFVTVFNVADKTITTYRPSSEDKLSVSYAKNGYDCDASWGENTAACLEDVYSNHGWISVWAVVQSAFLPQTAAALAAGCAIDAYNPYNGDGCYSDPPEQ